MNCFSQSVCVVWHNTILHFLLHSYCVRHHTLDFSELIKTVAGDANEVRLVDGGLATSTILGTSSCVAVDASGNIYIAVSYNNRIRMVMKSTGIITTVAGTGYSGFSGDGGLATSATLYRPCGVDVDATGKM
jgi:trimeric autotransporter adhesin